MGSSLNLRIIEQPLLWRMNPKDAAPYNPPPLCPWARHLSPVCSGQAAVWLTLWFIPILILCVLVSVCQPGIDYRNRTFHAYYVYEASLSSFASSSYQAFAQCMFNRSVFPLLINQQCAVVCYCQQVLNDDYLISISASCLICSTSEDTYINTYTNTLAATCLSTS